MQHDLTVRPIEAGDESEWRRLWTAYLAFYDSVASEDVYRSSFARLIDPGERDCHGLLAVVGGRPAGLVHYLYHRHMWKLEDVCYLQDLYADPELRGKGVGRALIEAVYAAADANGTPTVYWMTQEFNHPARRLYDRIGTKTPFIKYNRF
ncbi:GNAT family N-acetyltransferase [Jiella sonneratiae]|uniref:GNAT family N-acetyltransferase n=1 Tax=Jiella sonneratiae TaxID=2816856 RepID=A0ABS3IYJ4_9HYPH|nr:GNAT family N-acetyltransferase [Jiella sonneratiae]MBO0902478.1 GNAT family N-acetyltransferase [Jiella sonneratiae]